MIRHNLFLCIVLNLYTRVRTQGPGNLKYILNSVTIFRLTDVTIFNFLNCFNANDFFITTQNVCTQSISFFGEEV